MHFEWDVEKEQKNIKKHKIDFTLASTVFADAGRIELYDEDHSLDEDRYITIGRIYGSMVVVTMVYTEREEIIRIISARKATKEERGAYYEKQNRNRY